MSNKIRIPSLGLHAASGQARVLIDGRHIYLGKYGSVEAEEKYRRIVAEWLANGQVPPMAAAEKAEPEPFTINCLAIAFWHHAEKHYRKNGQPTREISVLKTPIRVLRSLYGTLPVAEFSPLKLKAVRDELVRAGQSRLVVNGNTSRIRRMFAWGVENELVPPSVLHGLKAVPGLRRGRTEAKESQPVRPIDEAIVNKVLPHLGRQVRDMVRLQLLTGCRPGEICIIRPCDVNRDGEVWEYTPESHKTEHHGRDRRIFLGPRAQAILTSYLDNRPATSYCFRPSEAVKEHLVKRHTDRRVPLSCGNRPGKGTKPKPQRRPGNRYDANSYRIAIHRACKRAKVPPWNPNRLRHSRATDLRRRYGIEAAQTVLGHAELAVTQVYAERDFEAARRIMAEVG